MKAFVLLFALLVSSSAFAENIIIKKNDPLFLQYIESTTAALELAKKDMCRFGNKNPYSYHDVSLLLRYTTEIRIITGAQSRLEFDTSNTPYAYADRAVVAVVTIPGSQKIVSVEVRNYKKTRVNTGDLLNPKMIEGSQRDDRFFCKN